MDETSPGVYQGQYFVKSTDKVNRAIVIGRLADHFGMTRKKVFQGAIVTIKPQQTIAQVPNDNLSKISH